MGYFLNRAKAFLQSELTGGQPAPADRLAGLGCEISEKSELSPAMPGAGQRLPKALADKQHELALRRRDLASPYYQGDPWVSGQIALLEGHIAEITRYLKEGGELALPRCCRQANLICLAAMRGFNICILSPGGCGYAIQG